MMDLKQREEAITHILLGCFEEYERETRALDEIVSNGCRVIIGMFTIERTSESS